MTALLLAAATLIVRAVLLLALAGAIAFITVLLAEQVHLIRTAIHKENRHDRHA